MKKFFFLAIILTLAAACQPKEKEESLTFSVTPDSISFSGEDSSSKFITVSTNGDWTASTQASWLQLDKASGSGSAAISVSADPNPDNSARSAEVTVKAVKGSVQQSFTVAVSQSSSEKIAIVPAPDLSGAPCSSMTYQLLIYSFADSDGDGVGDFKGIQNKLDYLKSLGATALWLSPAHPTNSYHAYDVNDYFSINPLYATGSKTSAKAEADFKELIDAAHAKGIKIYMDYVLNHSGTGTTWFKSLQADPTGSPYRDYYVTSTKPSADEAAGRIDNYGGRTSPGMGGWTGLGGGYKGRLHFKLDWTKSTKYITVTETTEATQSSNPSASKWIFIGSAGNIGLYETSTNIFEITIDVDTSWGFLVRTSTSSWDGGTKYGGRSGASAITFGVPFQLDNSTASDITIGETVYYFGSFDKSMPDLNYGPYGSCEESPLFKELVNSAGKWVEMGVDGFRLDAVIWIYQTSVAANQRFLDQWYQAVNSRYKAAGHSDNIFMVGEAWEGHNTEKLYYKGLTSCFEFAYWRTLRDAVSGSGASNYASTVMGYIKDHSAQRSDAVTSIMMTNHDKSSITLEGQGRAADDLGKDLAKEKQAAAMMLSTGGKPFVYQGEELGYWGDAHGGDEYIRAPILWDKAGKDCAKKGVNNKVDNTMLTGSISVEAQEADPGSLLNVYKTWGQLRNAYPALGAGEMSATSLSGATIASWYMSSGSQKLLVIHNCSATERSVTVDDDMSRPIALLGSAYRQEKVLTLGANSSVIFQL